MMSMSAGRVFENRWSFYELCEIGVAGALAFGKVFLPSLLVNAGGAPNVL